MATLRVPGTYPTISGAVAASAPGDIILVAAGYAGNEAVGNHHVGPLDLSADARADLASNIKSGLIGPRFAFKLPLFPLRPYAEVLGGGSVYPNTPNGLPIANKFVGRIVGGLDATILPRLDWRVVDYSYGLNSASRQQTITSGLVIRF